MTLPPFLRRRRKALVAAANLLAGLVANGTLHGSAQVYANIALGVLTLLGVHQAENELPPAPVAEV